VTSSLEPDDPAGTAEQDAERYGVDPIEDRIRIHDALSSHEGPLDEPTYSPGVTGPGETGHARFARVPNAAIGLWAASSIANEQRGQAALLAEGSTSMICY
jgi:hypothetical protein